MFRSAQEEGSIESFLVLIPILLTSVVVLSLFQYGITSNALAGEAMLVGRALARYPESADFEELTEQVLQRQGIKVSDFHVMRIVLGKRVFIQLTLVGKKLSIGSYSIAPSGKSLTLIDSWG
jgi:hypothetical protein